MRGALATLLVAAALAAALVVQTMAYVGRDLLETRRFADVTVAALRSEAGTALVARTLTDALAADLGRRGIAPGDALLARVDAAVRQATARPEVGGALRPAVVAAHREVLARPERGVRVDLALLRPGVVAAVGGVDPALTPLVPAASAFPTLTVPLDGGAEAAVHAARRLRDGWPALALAGIAALLGALALTSSRAAVLRGAGAGLLVLALVPPLVRALAPEAARAAAPPGTGPLAAEFTRRLAGGWVEVAAWTAAGGLALLALAAVSAPRRGPGRGRR